jgi:hypothetical protein
MQHDPNRPEDVLKVDAYEDGVGGDDAADCLRYLVATKARTVEQRKLTGLWLTFVLRWGPTAHKLTGRRNPASTCSIWVSRPLFNNQ